MKRRTKIYITVATVAMAVGIPWFLHAQKTTQRNACLNNLRMIDGVQCCCVPLANNLAFGDQMDPDECFQYVKGATCPTCPAGGQYIISWIVGGPYPKCTVHGDLLQIFCGNRTFKEGIRRRAPGETPEKAFSDPMARRPRIRKPPRTYVSGINPGLPDLGPLMRVASAAIGTITNSDHDLNGHFLELHAIRSEHHFLQAKKPAGFSYIAVYRDSTLRNGNATGVDIEIQGNDARFKSQKGFPLLSASLDGKVKVPEDVITTIALAAITNFWPQMDTNRLLLEEIVCCDPINGNDYSVNFRLNGSLTERADGSEYTRVEVDVTTNGNVKEDEIEWKTMFVANLTQTNMTHREKEEDGQPTNPPPFGEPRRFTSTFKMALGL